MNKDKLLDFAKIYSPEQFDQIAFDWNGKHGNDFMDKNGDFRIQLCEAIKDNLSTYSEQLIIDLYLELSKSAKETYSVYNSFHLFANELLERCGTKYFDQYLEGASKSMDTGMSSGRLDLSHSRINEILKYIHNKIEESNQSSDFHIYNFMLKRFEWLLKKKQESL